MTTFGSLAMSSYHFAAQKFNILRQKEQNDKCPSYIDLNYDVKFIFSPVDANPNFLLRISNALVGMLNQTRLPRIIIFLLDSDFVKITAGYSLTEWAIAKLISQTVIDIGKRKSQIDKKAYNQMEPKFLIMKPTARAEGFDDFIGGRNNRCIFNRSLEKIICKYYNFFTFNMHRIRPEKKYFFDETKTKLSDTGFKAYWRALHDVVRQIDSGRLKPFKELVKKLEAQDQRSPSNDRSHHE